MPAFFTFGNAAPVVNGALQQFASQIDVAWKDEERFKAELKSTELSEAELYEQHHTRATTTPFPLHDRMEVKLTAFEDELKYTDLDVDAEAALNLLCDPYFGAMSFRRTVSLTFDQASSLTTRVMESSKLPT
ncbi:hypothetical protein Q5752_000011 [Cryptotrichosporon argae]